MKRFLNIVYSFGLTASFSALAWAADPFTVSGVSVDATGDNAIAAQTEAMTVGQDIAAKILLDRLTLPKDARKVDSLALDQQTISRMIRALNVDNEKRSANRYLGDITVAFNPSQVQQFLRAQGLTMMSNQSRERLVLPVMDGTSVWSDNEWVRAWQNSAFSHALTPLKGLTPGSGSESLASTTSIIGADMATLRRVGQRFGVDQILIAKAGRGAGGYRVNLVDVALDSGQKRSLGSVTASSLTGATRAVLDKVEDDWKSASVSLANNAEPVTVSVLYRSHSDWIALQKAINGSAQIQDARLDALSKDGALMTLTYGDFDRLKNELRFKGVDVRRDQRLGVVISRAGRN